MMKIDRKLVIWLMIAGFAPKLFFLLQSVLGDGFDFSVESSIGFCVGTFFSVIYTATIGVGVTLFINKIHHRIPVEGGIFKRYFVLLGLTNVIAVLLMTFLTWLTLLTPIMEELNQTPREIYKDHILITIVMDTLLVTLSEAMFYFERWKQSVLEKEQLEKENIQSQFQSLKNQVNPHFLFNSLNTLSSLIYSNPDLAEDFIDEFARVYRYILEFDDKHLVTVQEELNFLESFVYLHQIRFGNHLTVEINIPEKIRQEYIPPFSLQILIENAIKHNIISEKHPLHIELNAFGETIQVKNNLQLRVDREVSTGFGLKNLKKRYELFARKTPTFEQTESEYIATIPFLINE